MSAVHRLLRIWKFLGRWPALQRFLLRLLNDSFMIGIVAVVLDQQDRVVLFHHSYRRRFPWGLPGGWLRRGEEPDQALIREIKEETGLDAEILRPLTAIAEPVKPDFEVIYLARVIGGTFRPSVEVDEIGYYTVDNLPPLKPYQKELILRAFPAPPIYVSFDQTIAR